jgi:hypothetical protein
MHVQKKKTCTFVAKVRIQPRFINKKSYKIRKIIEFLILRESRPLKQKTPMGYRCMSYFLEQSKYCFLSTLWSQASLLICYLIMVEFTSEDYQIYHIISDHAKKPIL